MLKLEAWARNGCTDETIAEKIGINRQTLYEWKNKHKDISNALKRGKEPVDIEVENALLKKTQGYNVQLKKTFKIKRAKFDENTGRKLEEYEELVEGIDEIHVPADTTAQIFWLKNRKPDDWRDKREITQNGGANEIIQGLASIMQLSQQPIENRDLSNLEGGD